MKNNLFGLTLSKIVTLLLCFIAAVILWLYVYYSEGTSVTEPTALLQAMRTVL